MARVTRVMYLLSGILIMASGLYVQLSPANQLSRESRIVVGLVCIAYFGYQLYKFLIAECTNSTSPMSITNRDNFGLDFMEQ